MNQFLSAPVTDAQLQRDALLGALVGLARSTVNEPKTEDTDRVLTSGLRLAADPDAAEDALRRMYHIVETEKHHVAPRAARTPAHRRSLIRPFLSSPKTGTRNFSPPS